MEFNETKHLLDFDDMDSYHQEFVEVYSSLEDTTIQGYKNVMIKIFEQTKVHFCHEEELMQKYNYPRIKEHSDEHKKVLHEMKYFIDKSHTIFGKNMLKSYYNEALPNWFDSHLLSMDSDLSSYLKNKLTT